MKDQNNPSIINRLINKIKRSRSRKYKVGQHYLLLPPNHLLPEYQKKHPLYDRFLPVLVKVLGNQGCVVDIGANVGDSLFSIIDNCMNEIICIEPSDRFYSYLLKNIESLPLASKDRIKTYKRIISADTSPGYLSHNSGTATFIVEKNSNSNLKISLDALLPEKNISLIKSDTDGFDFDVILSATKIIREQVPILYWENLVTNMREEKSYEELYQLLESYGYSYLCVFNNYGEILLEGANFESLKSLNMQIANEYTKGKLPYIRYTDVLACSNRDQFMVKRAIDSYRQIYCA
ncbi:MAG: FkbM family methyltransferase [Crocinitomicaceae bacterium]|nr:FkbM family methyltransferase [Crocinitomicaceae bacterium]